MSISCSTRVSIMQKQTSCSTETLSTWSKSNTSSSAIRVHALSYHRMVMVEPGLVPPRKFQQLAPLLAQPRHRLRGKPKDRQIGDHGGRIQVCFLSK